MHNRRTRGQGRNLRILFSSAGRPAPRQRSLGAAGGRQPREHVPRQGLQRDRGAPRRRVPPPSERRHCTGAGDRQRHGDGRASQASLPGGLLQAPGGVRHRHGLGGGQGARVGHRRAGVCRATDARLSAAPLLLPVRPLQLPLVDSRVAVHLGRGGGVLVAAPANMLAAPCLLLAAPVLLPRAEAVVLQGPLRESPVRHSAGRVSPV
mmetsp:Transcript_82673/g.215765  ORF Transcript_82673/g.215765 Transcript_82673/m.215765 type:complete len:207 (-) Transcript_82673:2108-2728(-)